MQILMLMERKKPHQMVNLLQFKQSLEVLDDMPAPEHGLQRRSGSGGEEGMEKEALGGSQKPFKPFLSSSFQEVSDILTKIAFTTNDLMSLEKN